MLTGSPTAWQGREEVSEDSATPDVPAPPKPAKRPWTPPPPECAYLRLDDFPHLYSISTTTAWRCAQRGVLPFMKIPGTSVMLFPRERTERIIKSWEQNGHGRRRGKRSPAPTEAG